MKSIEEYRELRDWADNISEKLIQIHGDNITCKPRCCGCCVNLTVFPVEFYAILNALKADGVTRLDFDDSASCGFLKDNMCTIYKHHPLICRTHGLPIAFLSDEEENPGYSVSFCDSNFTQVPNEQLIFGPENTLNLDELNNKLLEINLKFIEEIEADEKFTPTDRIPLKHLIDFFK